MERTFFHSRDEEPRLPCITRLHIEKTVKHWHIVVFVNDHCAGVLMVPPECGPAMADLLMPPECRIEGKV
jgi:hypothetical protein